MVNYSEDGAAHVFQLENFFVEKTCKFKLSTIQFFSKMTKYSPGNIISAECPLVHILNDDKKSQFCDNCLLKSENLKKCSNCKQMYYCSALCQKKDWKSAHKYECENVYKPYYSYFHRNLDRFLLRLYLVLTNKSNLLSKKDKLQHDESIERCFEDLITHKEDISKDFSRMRHFDFVCQRYNSCNISFDKNVLFEYFCKICINSFSILDVSLNEIGSSLYIANSYFDHSCVPNATTIFSGTYLEIRAIKEIDVGDKIYINYVDVKNDKVTRQKSLKEQYYFECTCPRCKSDFDKDFDSQHLKKLNSDMDDFIDIRSQWRAAYDLGKETIPLLTTLYGEYHPDKTLQLVRLAKLYLLMYGGDLDNEGIDLIGNAGKHISVTHGHNHELYKIYREVLNFD